MKTLKIRTEQNIFDIAVQEYGGVEGVLQIIKDNPGVDNLDHVFKNGDEIQVDDQAPVDLQIKKIYASRGVVPTTGEEDLPGGDWNNDFNNDFNII